MPVKKVAKVGREVNKGWKRSAQGLELFMSLCKESSRKTVALGKRRTENEAKRATGHRWKIQNVQVLILTGPAQYIWGGGGG